LFCHCPHILDLDFDTFFDIMRGHNSSLPRVTSLLEVLSLVGQSLAQWLQRSCHSETKRKSVTHLMTYMYLVLAPFSVVKRSLKTCVPYNVTLVRGVG